MPNVFENAIGFKMRKLALGTGRGISKELEFKETGALCFPSAEPKVSEYLLNE